MEGERDQCEYMEGERDHCEYMEGEGGSMQVWKVRGINVSI